MKDYRKLRLDYKKHTLDIKDCGNDPIAFFEKWLEEAINVEILDVTAFCLSTADKELNVHSRIVLLKELKKDGFVFYTNYKSKKGIDIEQNPKVSLNFFWKELERQVRIEGICEKISDKESDDYFNQRPRDSQIGAIASNQSSVLASKEELISRFEQLKEAYQNQRIDRPKWWGGYLVKPCQIEFWQGRPSRLHDRIAFKKSNEQWISVRLAP